MNKRIAVDCFKLIKGEGASIGIYNYTVNLIQNLSKLNKFQIYVFGNSNNKKDFDLKNINFINIEYIFRNKLSYIFWELFHINKFISKYNINLIIFPRGYLPFIKKCKTINIVHDMIPFYYYENFRKDINFFENYYIRKRLLSSIRNSDLTITISNYSKEMILKYLRNNQSNIRTIYNGYNKLNYIPDERKVDTKYIITITSDKYKHKNLEGILKSYQYYVSNTTNPLKLFIIGVKNKDNLIIDNKLNDHIVFFNFLNDEDFIKLMFNAEIFLFLSLIEGFGFPPLEAMNLGVPVICSKNSSLTEIVKDGGILVDSDDFEKITENLIKIENDKILKNTLINNGYENLERFKWSDIIKDYEDAINQTI